MPEQNSSQGSEKPENRRGGVLSRSAWMALGWIALALGVAGIPLPLLPTTPFVLLAAFAFGKGSPYLRQRMVSDPRFGPIINDWERHGAIAPRYKVLACTLMAGAFCAGIYFGLSPMILTIQGIFITSAALFIITRPGK